MVWTRRRCLVLLTVASLLSWLCGGRAAEEVRKKSNVLFILLDNVGKDWFRCYGSQEDQTLNIDRLAATGLKFTEHELHALMAPRPFLVSGGKTDLSERWPALKHTIEANELLSYGSRVAMTNRPTHGPTEEPTLRLEATHDGQTNESNIGGDQSAASPTPTRLDR